MMLRRNEGWEVCVSYDTQLNTLLHLYSSCILLFSVLLFHLHGVIISAVIGYSKPPIHFISFLQLAFMDTPI